MGLDMMMYRADSSINLPAYPSEVPVGFGASRSEDEQNQVDVYWAEIERLHDQMEEVAYWRKFNALHSWLVTNVQGGQDDCQYSEVSRGDLEELSDILAESLETEEVLLEPQCGFFFGSTEVDEYYWEDVKNALDQINEILETIDFDTHTIYYHASW